MDATAVGRPLAGKRVAVTRAREQSHGLVERLNGLGAEVVEFPAISIVPPEDYALLDNAIGRLEEYDWVIFTSVNGVAAFTARMAELGADPSRLRSRKLGAIGPATAAALERAGCPPTFVPGTYVAEAVVEQIGEVRGCRVLLPRADIARKALAEGLRDKGAVVDEITAYRTVPGEGGERLVDLLRSGNIDAITFTSSSTVRYTLENLQSSGLEEQQAVDLLNRANVVCIGPITAGTAEEHGLKVAMVAGEYTSEGLVGALVALLGTAKDGGHNAGSE